MSLQERNEGANLNKGTIYKRNGELVEITDQSGIPRAISYEVCQLAIEGIVRENYDSGVAYWQVKQKFMKALRYFPQKAVQSAS